MEVTCHKWEAVGFVIRNNEQSRERKQWFMRCPDCNVKALQEIKEIYLKLII